MRRILTLLLCLALLCAAGTVSPARAENALTAEGFTRMAEGNGLALYLHEESGEIALQDATGYVWRSAVTDQCELSGLTYSQQMLAASPLLVEYTLLNNRSDQSTRKAIAELGLTVTYEPLTDGVRVVYHAEDIALEVTVEYTLLPDGLRVHIPADGIREGVGMDEKLASSMETLLENLAWMRNVIVVMAQDEDLKAHWRSIGRFSKAFENFAAELEGITTTVDIKNTVDKATALMTTCQSIYKGGVGEEGVFNAIVADEKISVDVRQYYKQVYT